MQRVALGGSVIAHAVLALAILALRPVATPPAPPASPIAIDVVEPAPVPPRPVPAPGGGAPVGRASRARSVAPRSRPDLAWSIDRPGDGEAGAGGSGHGRGGGHGDGLGAGAELARDQLAPAIPAPPAAVVSKARPPKLIYPSRERDVEDARLFVARLTIDSDGFVVGAHLVRGFGGPRDDQAAGVVWRFRYAPALDDAGCAITATIDQHFMVE